jgi:hypothetical protein
LLTPVLVLGVLGLVRFMGCDILFGLQHIPDPPLDFVTDKVLGTARNDFTGFAGMAVEIGGKSLNVKNLQRYCISGSSGTPRVEIIDAETGTMVPTAVVVVSLTGHNDVFVSADLPGTITLTAGKRFYIVSEETTGGDQFFDSDTVLTTRSDAAVVSPVYFDSTVQNWVLLGNPGSSYGPVNFGYDKP